MARDGLTDEQIWALLTADPTVTDRELATQLGLNQKTIHSKRWRLKRQGWTCVVSFGTCAHCGTALVRRGRYATGQKYHVDCRKIVVRQQIAAHDRRRWERATASTQAVIIERAHQHSARYQEQSVARATRRGLRWAPWEDDLIMAPDALPDHLLAGQLDRTLFAIRTRRQVLRRMNRASSLLPEPTERSTAGEQSDI